MTQLTIYDHSRSFNDFIYIYPVVSRRAQGISLGINLNINNACNWRCIYCQVEGLVRGKPTTIDLIRLEYELDYMLDWITNGDFISKNTPVELNRFNDICFSGNGEPTLSPDFFACVQIVAKLRKKYNLGTSIKSILITNGSEIERSDVITALALLAKNNGEMWFKIDRASENSINDVNQVHLSTSSIKKRLLLASSVCKTYVQTCMFRIKNIDPSTTDINQYISFIIGIKSSIAGVLLYSTARNPALPEGNVVSSVSKEFLSTIAARLAHQDILVTYYQ